MSTRRVRPLPEPWAVPILTLVQITRAAITAPDVDPGPWAAAECGQTPIRTGYKAARRTASAGQYAAHLLRLQAARDVDAGRAAHWLRTLAGLGPALSSWDPEERAAGAVALYRNLIDAAALGAEQAQGARLVASWLGCHRGPELVATTAALCTYVLEQPDLDVDDVVRAWDATHGHRLHRGSGAA